MLQGLHDRAKNPARKLEYQRELAAPPAPASLIYLLQIYHRIRRRKAGNGFGPSPVEWPDIDAFVRNAGIVLAPWELEIIETLDDVFLSAKPGET